MRTFDYICSSCHEKLKLDLDYKIIHCPLCGQRLQMDMEQVWQLLEAQESGEADSAAGGTKTPSKPVLSREEREARMKKAEHRFHVAAFGIIGVILLIEIIAVIVIMTR